MASWFDVAGFSYQEFSAGGIRTFAIVEGRIESCPLVLLHCVPGASFVWSTTVSAIGRARRIIAPDLPGWGRSHHRMLPQKIQLTRDGLRGWLSEVIQAQQGARCDLAGIGDGAWLALDYLKANSQSVRRLALLNLPLKPRAARRVWPWQKREWTRGRLNDWIARESGLNESNRIPLKPLFDELFAGGWHAERSPEFPVNEFAAQLTEYRGPLRAFDGEVLLGWGVNSAGYDGRKAAQFAQGREIVVWHEAANFPMWEQPRQYSQEMTEFFSA